VSLSIALLGGTATFHLALTVSRHRRILGYQRVAAADLAALNGAPLLKRSGRAAGKPPQSQGSTGEQNETGNDEHLGSECYARAHVPPNVVFCGGPPSTLDMACCFRPVRSNYELDCIGAHSARCYVL
jgi:hypothetical protein